MQVLPNGAKWIPGYLPREKQIALVEVVRRIVEDAPLFVPLMPKTGKPMSVRMTNCGDLGWVTDKEKGYRYQTNHPKTGKSWPIIPSEIMDIWKDISGYNHLPEACLINFYEETAKMGLHQDRDESDFEAPVVSISLGDSCLFRLGENTRSGRTTSFKLQSGDAVILTGKSRMAFHGVDRIYPDTSTLLKNGGRINLTLRRVTKP
ncbi:MAG: alpha-ketoglutarate-dependent dioxygenase AlkB [Salaquimonas sp.]